MTAGTFREKQAEGKVTYRDKQEREREEETDRRGRMQTGLQQPVRLRNQTRAVVWKNMLPLPASTAPPPGYRSRGPAQSCTRASTCLKHSHSSQSSVKPELLPDSSPSPCSKLKSGY